MFVSTCCCERNHAHMLTLTCTHTDTHRHTQKQSHSRTTAHSTVHVASINVHMLLLSLARTKSTVTQCLPFYNVHILQLPLPFLNPPMTL